MKQKSLQSILTIICCTTYLQSAPVWALTGGVGGGGGDSLAESRMDDIREDILTWIKKGGAKSLKFTNSQNYKNYKALMTEALTQGRVVLSTITSAESKKTNDPEKKVEVDGVAKTCRGFFSVKDSRPHILCNVERLNATPENKQYELIHHEFAGLVKIEKNIGAASDYSLSKQITKFLEVQPVLKLAVKDLDQDEDFVSEEIWQCQSAQSNAEVKSLTIRVDHKNMKSVGQVTASSTQTLIEVTNESPLEFKSKISGQSDGRDNVSFDVSLIENNPSDLTQTDNAQLIDGTASVVVTDYQDCLGTRKNIEVLSCKVALKFKAQ